MLSDASSIPAPCRKPCGPRSSCGPLGSVVSFADGQPRPDDERLGDENWWQAWRRRRRGGAPGLSAILMRAGTVGNEIQRRIARAQADLVIDPPLDGIGLTHWKKFDAAVAAGYRAVSDFIEKNGLPAALKNAA